MKQTNLQSQIVSYLAFHSLVPQLRVIKNGIVYVVCFKDFAATSYNPITRTMYASVTSMEEAKKLFNQPLE